MKLTSTITLPPDTACRTLAVIAQKGSGKTYTGMKITELLWAAGSQIAAIDLAAIICLLFSRGPATVAWFVIAVVIGKAIYGMLVAGTLSHIIHKCLEAFAPCSANAYTSTTITVVVSVVGVVASLLHQAPDVVLGCLCHAVCGLGFFDAL